MVGEVLCKGFELKVGVLLTKLQSFGFENFGFGHCNSALVSLRDSNLLAVWRLINLLPKLTEV